MVTRRGTGIKQVHLGITPDYLIIASHHADGIDPDSESLAIECLELDSIIPLELIHISAHSHRHYRLRIRICNGAVRYYELSEFTQPEAKWRSWCDRLDFLNSDLTSSSTGSQTSLSDVTMTTHEGKEAHVTQMDKGIGDNWICRPVERQTKKTKTRQQRKVQGFLEGCDGECNDQVGVIFSPKLLDNLLGPKTFEEERETLVSRTVPNDLPKTPTESRPVNPPSQRTVCRFASGVAERCENRLTLGEFSLPRGFDVSRGSEPRGDQLPIGRVSPSPFCGAAPNPLCSQSPFQSLDNVLRCLDPDWYKPASLPANKWCGADVGLGRPGNRRLKTPREMSPCRSKGESVCAEKQSWKHASDPIKRFSCGAESKKISLQPKESLFKNVPAVADFWIEQKDRPYETDVLYKNVPTANVVDERKILPIFAEYEKDQHLAENLLFRNVAAPKYVQDKKKEMHRPTPIDKLRSFWSDCDDKTNLPFSRSTVSRQTPREYMKPATPCEISKLARRSTVASPLGSCKYQPDGLLERHFNFASERFQLDNLQGTNLKPKPVPATKLLPPIGKSKPEEIKNTVKRPTQIRHLTQLKESCFQAPVNLKAVCAPIVANIANYRVQSVAQGNDPSVTVKEKDQFVVTGTGDPADDKFHVTTETLVDQEIETNFKEVCKFGGMLPNVETPLAARLPGMVSQLPPCPIAKLIFSPPPKPWIWRQKVEPTCAKPIPMTPRSICIRRRQAYTAEWLAGRSRCHPPYRLIPCSPCKEYMSTDHLDIAENCVVMWELALGDKLLSKPEFVMPYPNTLCCMLELQRKNPLCRIRRVQSDPCLVHHADQTHGTDVLPISREKLLRTYSVSAFEQCSPEENFNDCITVFPSYEAIRKKNMAFWFLPLPLSISQDDFDPKKKQLYIRMEHMRTVRGYLECLASQCDPPTAEDMLKICAIQRCLLLPASNPMCDTDIDETDMRFPRKPRREGFFKSKVNDIIRAIRLRRQRSRLASKLLISPPKHYPDTFAIHKLNTRLMEFRSRVLASELTLIDKELLCRVPDTEIVGLGGKHAAAGNSYLHLKTLVAWHDRVVNLFTTEILANGSPDGRAQAIIKCLKIIQYMTEVCSYQSSRAILCALQSIPVYRLRRTWWILCDQYPSFFRKFCCMSAFYVDVCSCAVISQPGHKLPYLPFYGEVFCILLGNLGEIDVHLVSDIPATWIDKMTGRTCNVNISNTTDRPKRVIHKKKRRKQTACYEHTDVHINFHNLSAIGRAKPHPIDITSVNGLQRLSKHSSSPANCLELFHHFQEMAFYFNLPSNKEARSYLLRHPFCPPQYCFNMSLETERAKEVYPILRKRSGIF